MSVATEFAPVVFIPSHARLREQPMATVLEFRAPSASAAAAPVRLTRRGVWALAALVAVAAVGLVGLARLSAPPAAPSHGPAPAMVTVRAGDTLWSIATRVAPQRNPGDEIARLRRLNQLSAAAIVAGQVLHTR